MKHKKYLLHFDGDPEAVAFLKKKLPAVYEGNGALSRANAHARAAKVLFGVKCRRTSISTPTPQAQRMKSI